MRNPGERKKARPKSIRAGVGREQKTTKSACKVQEYATRAM